jgi:hypothetical protein
MLHTPGTPLLPEAEVTPEQTLEAVQCRSGLG